MKTILFSKALRLCCLLGSALGLISCASVPPIAGSSNRAPGKIAIQPETRWSTSASWWTNPNATALISADSFEDSAARMEANAKVISAIRKGSESSTITFRPIQSQEPTFTLSGPARLADFLAQGQEVHLEFDHTGKILRIGDMPELVSWKRSGNRHRIDLKTRPGKTFGLFVVDSQLFQGIADEPSQRNEADLDRQYDEWSAPETGKRYVQLTESEKAAYLESRVGFEVILTSSGVIFFTGEGYGGGAEPEPEWILSTSASEGFD